MDIPKKINIVKASNKTKGTKTIKISYQNNYLTSNPDIANSLNNYFSSLGHNLNKFLLSNLPPDDRVDFSLTAKTLASLKGHKNGGVNQRPAFIYKVIEPSK